MPKPITIVGGGLAGLTLGIALRQREIPVVLHEAGKYPRHRVCGEFINGQGRDVLRELSLEKKIFAAGALEAKTAGFFTTKTAGKTASLTQPALCLSRHILDQLLANELVQLGGDLRTQSRYQEDFASGVVRATGRRIQTEEKGWRWFGLKVHARNIEMSADLEIHLQPQGYVGLCKLPDGETNICGLFRSRVAVPDLGQTWGQWLQGQPGSALHERLHTADFIKDAFCSVSALSLAPQKSAAHSECNIGDAITMIAPVTGNGMSMAFESASIAVEPLTAYSLGKIDWAETQKTIARECDARFSRRLSWGSWLQWAVFRPELSGQLVRTISNFPSLWKILVTRTR